jgi:2-keto-4-pentenoate hydratase/2-oxohepta-3-ene-1,7-dioic acid hydratase in catechol pathway
MKLASFSFEGEDKLGVLVAEGRVVDIAAALGAATGAPPQAWARDMLALIQAGEPALEDVRNALRWVEANPGSAPLIPADRVTWHPPVRNPTKLCCLALNNSANVDRIVSGPKHPAIFIKGSNALLGHNSAIRIKKHFGRVHPEPELAVVVGRTATDIDPKDAFDYVFGYTIHNDITSPTMRTEDTFQYRAIHPGKNGGHEIEYVNSYTSYSGRYKGSDTFSPLGPWLVTRDDIEDPHDLTVTCMHKGEIVTEDNTRNLFHKVPDVLAFTSSYITLMPGDIISMGTALKAAVGTGRAVQNVDLAQLGGPVSVSIERIGTLSSEVVHV